MIRSFGLCRDGVKTPPNGVKSSPQGTQDSETLGIGHLQYLWLLVALDSGKQPVPIDSTYSERV